MSASAGRMSAGGVVRVRTASQRRAVVSRQVVEKVVALIAPILLLALWEAAAQARLINRGFFPAPSTIAASFLVLIRTTLPTDISISLGRAAIGFVIGALPALLLGVLMGLMPLVRAALQPIAGALFAIPKVAIVPLVIVIFGLGESSKWAIIASGVFFQVLVSTTAGVANIDRIYLDVGRNYGASRLATIWTIALPGALPVIFAGVKLGWAVSLLLLVQAEMVAAKSGLGYLIWNSWQIGRIDDVYVGILTVAALGMLSFWLLDQLEAWLIPWRSRQ
ncbi:MAG: ABC transporter permease [Chloroflexi bacterium]|nr:ABC transporter permease [Chloroflexota bacterium]